MRQVGVRRVQRDDRGNLVMALAVILVIVMLVAMMADRAIGNLHAVGNIQNFAGALANADAGVSDAQYQLQQGNVTPYLNGSGQYEFCVGPHTQCLGGGTTVVPSSPATQYKAVQTNANQWVIKSTSTLHGRAHAVRATLQNLAAYPWAMYGNTGLTFNGRTQTGGFGTYSSTTAEGSWNTSGQVSIGTNGTILCNGTLPSNVTVTYAPGGSESGCTDFTQTSYHSQQTVPPPSPSGSCPGAPTTITVGSTTVSGIAFGDALSALGSPSSLGPGIYICTSPIILDGNLSVPRSSNPTTNCATLTATSPPPTDVACLFVQLPPAINTSALPAIAITPGSSINGAGTAPPTPFPYPAPIAADLQIFSNAIGQIGGLGSSHDQYYFAGVIDAPQAFLTQDGCNSVYYGSVIANTISCNGAPNLDVYYDSGLGSIVTPWAVATYTEIPAPVSIP